MLPTVVNVRDLGPGDQLKISMKAGHAIEQDHTGAAAPPPRPRRARGFSRASFYAFLVQNDPAAGLMKVNVQGNVGGGSPNLFTATIPYAAILHLQQIVPYGRPVVETAPKTHPGAQALGTKMAQLFPQPYLIPVVFVGQAA